MITILVSGANGQLGYEVIKTLKKQGHIVYACDIANKQDDKNFIELDITDKDAVNAALASIKPDVVVHCAAWTNVDKAEEEEYKETVRQVNVEGTINIVEAVKNTATKLVFISTDYVFDGSGSTAHKTVDNNLKPLNYYGQTKLEAEQYIRNNLSNYFIVRTSWLYGINGNNFVKTMIRLGKEKDEISVVSDQVGSPTYASDLSQLLAQMCLSTSYGTYHATNMGNYISWYDFCKAIYRHANINIKVNPVETKDYNASKAKRPLNSRLDKSDLEKNGFTPLPDWEDALVRFLKEIEDLWQK